MAASPFRPIPWLVLAVFLLFGLAANAQIDNVYVYGTVKDYNTSKKLDGITVSVLKDGAQFTQVVTSANGKYEFNLDYGHDYKLVFDKVGMVGKNVSINTTGIPDADRQGGLAMNVEMTLFQELPGIDFKLLQQPIGKSKYDPDTKNLAWDLAYTEQIRAEMERLLKEYDDKKKREAGADEDYAKAMKAGTDAMAAASYEKAVKSFTDALGLKPADPVATAKLSDAQIKLNELSAASKKEAQYAELIKAADGFFGKKQYEEAKAKYQEATQVKDQEAYPKQKIKECDAFIDDLAKKAEADKKAKELDDQFKAAVAAGDAAFKAENYELAKTSFTQAQSLKPAEKYPPEQLAAIAKKLDELAKKAEEDAKNKELDANYQAAIDAGDASFKKRTTMPRRESTMKRWG
jgi:tetratricopeptide (TPR) repeat protein